MYEVHVIEAGIARWGHSARSRFRARKSLHATCGSAMSPAPFENFLLTMQFPPPKMLPNS